MLNNIYRDKVNLMIGFHGCGKSVRDALVSNPNHIMKSQETFDWLGHGFYVWENNYLRALQWANDKRKRSENFEPAVVGVVYQLNYCLDFSETEYTDLISDCYKLMYDDFKTSNKTLPANRNIPNDENKDMVIRELDCAVIEYLHAKIDYQISNDIRENGFSDYRHFETVRGIFTEGGPAFEGAGIQSKSHIQICIRNLNCIKGFFIPRKEVGFP